MFVLYPLEEDSREYTILTRPKRIRLATVPNHQSVWMIPGTVSAGDYRACDHL
jgi:hypothetical protein